jgi:DNA-directed RNA polymerase specialized sigma24 family protein
MLIDEFKSVKFDEIDEYEEESYAQNFNYNNYPDDFDIVSDYEFNEMLNELIAELQDDEVAYFVFEYLILGYGNSEIANELGISVSDVVNAKKRIKRKFLKIIKK